MPLYKDNRSPVLRLGAQNYLLISLVSFAGSVIFTRLFLAATGYPKIGSGDLHIAHVLWGGLILFIAALLPLIYANRWAFVTSAFLSGVGVGLFIDEVGKFITMKNDYFYPPAAPIIYAVFLLTVMVYLRVRKPPAWNARNEFYRVLEGFLEVLDHDLEPAEKVDLLLRLERIQELAQEEDLRHLAQALIEVLKHEKVKIVPERLSYTEKTVAVLQKLEMRLFDRERMRLGLILALTIVGALAFGEVSSSLLKGGNPFSLGSILIANIHLGQVRSVIGANWFFVHLSLQAIVGLLALFSAALIVTGREKRGLEMGTVCLVLSLTLVNLLAFYVDQFSAAAAALVQLAVLLVLVLYRQRYFHPKVML